MGFDGWPIGSHLIEIYDTTHLLQSNGCLEATSPLHASDFRFDISEVPRLLEGRFARASLNTEKKTCMIYSPES